MMKHFCTFIFLGSCIHSTCLPKTKNKINLLVQIKFDNRNNNKVSAQLAGPRWGCSFYYSSVRVKNGSDWSWCGAAYWKCDKLAAVVTFPPRWSDLTFQRVFLCWQGLWKIMTAILHQQVPCQLLNWWHIPWCTAFNGLPIKPVTCLSISIISKAVVRKKKTKQRNRKLHRGTSSNVGFLRNQWIKFIQFQSHIMQYKVIFLQRAESVLPRQTSESAIYRISRSEY